MLNKRRMLAGLATLAVAIPTGLAALNMASPANAAPAILPLTITNHSGRSEPMYIYVTGELPGSRLGRVDEAGNFSQWPAAGVPPVPAPEFAISGPANGQSKTIRIPKIAGGRIWFSYGDKLKFFIVGTPNGTGLVSPDVLNPSDANVNTLFDFSEFTYNDGGLWLNSSQVDMLSIPHTVGVTGSNGVSTHTGTMIPNGRAIFFEVLKNQPGGWANLITRRGGWPLRAIAPSKGLRTGKLSPTILDSAINKAWDTYRTKTLNVSVQKDGGTVTYKGTTSGNTLQFRNSAGQVVTSFNKPSSQDVFDCAGNLPSPNDGVTGPISAVVCAALNRGTLASNSNQPDLNTADFYKTVDSNQYARKIHARMIDGKAYAFPYDDVGDLASIVHDGNPSSASITIEPLG